MTRTKTLSLLAAAAAVALVALVVAGCGGGEDQATAAESASMPSGGSATIGASDAGGLGKILVDSKGRSVYLFEKDTGSSSNCYASCATAWPPVTVSGMPSAGSGVSQSMLGTTKRSDGRTQVTYNGHPLYLYVGGWNSGGQLTAHLSDGSAADIVDASFSSATTQYKAVYALSYRAASAGQTLTVQWTQVSGVGNVTLQAAALGNGGRLSSSQSLSVARVNLTATGTQGWAKWPGNIQKQGGAVQMAAWRARLGRRLTWSARRRPPG